ncbi:hypothetical protein HMPREF0742_01339 [Rothia aeria F0184]|uniref:Uncharacterized protein n=1 Tax=Rothia aeria F0184 TaxID=888019 RepID=U7V337_9MICC|nr:hypothetical protein HMPREF0742_01339 [Rothia aeria F0184]
MICATGGRGECNTHVKIVAWDTGITGVYACRSGSWQAWVQ